MYTSYIGKKFLRLYNEREGKDLTAKQFFEEIIFPLFFNSDKHFLNVANSSFFQSVSQELLKSGKTIHQIKLERFQKNVEEDGASLTTLVGYAAQGIQAGTSGQVTSLNIELGEEEMYSSWVGSGFAIAMGGGYSILIDKDDLLWGLFDGWEIYRNYLKQTDNLKGNQIDVWNSYWVVHALSDLYLPDFPMNEFQQPEFLTCKAEKWKKLGYVEFGSNNWVKIMFTLAKKFPKEVLTISAFKFADTNQTLGFINLYLPEVRKMYELRDAIFIEKSETVLKDKEIENLQTFFNFKNACQLGTIGLKALEPDKLRTYMPKGSVMYAQGKDFKFTNDNSLTNYNLYKLWITAMLNKTELLNLAAEVAKALLDVEKPKEGKNDRGKTTSSRLVEEIKDSANIKIFIEKLSLLLLESPSNADIYKSVVEHTLKMPTDNFPLFITLIRFEYQYQKSKSN